MRIGLVDVEIDSATARWVAGLSVDADGASNAYGPPGTDTLDDLREAGHPGNWWGIIVDEDGEPVVQGEDDPAPGRYVSTTALVDHACAETDPRRYVDATSVPYVSIPPELRHAGVHLGDVALVRNLANGRESAAIVADVGPARKIGEGSIALAEALGLDGSPGDGGASHGIEVVVFLHSNQGWPRGLVSLQSQVAALAESNALAQRPSATDSN